MILQEGADTVDINMGCPVNKITKNGGGSSLLRDSETVEVIVPAVVQAVEVLVTAKTRSGWSDKEINILEFAKRMEDADAQMITIHGGTRPKDIMAMHDGNGLVKSSKFYPFQPSEVAMFFSRCHPSLPRRNRRRWSDVFALVRSSF